MSFPVYQNVHSIIPISAGLHAHFEVEGKTCTAPVVGVALLEVNGNKYLDYIAAFADSPVMVNSVSGFLKVGSKEQENNKGWVGSTSEVLVEMLSELDHSYHNAATEFEGYVTSLDLSEDKTLEILRLANNMKARAEDCAFVAGKKEGKRIAT